MIFHTSNAERFRYELFWGVTAWHFKSSIYFILIMPENTSSIRLMKTCWWLRGSPSWHNNITLFHDPQKPQSRLTVTCDVNTTYRNPIFFPPVWCHHHFSVSTHSGFWEVWKRIVLLPCDGMWIVVLCSHTLFANRGNVSLLQNRQNVAAQRGNVHFSYVSLLRHSFNPKRQLWKLCTESTFSLWLKSFSPALAV